MADDSDILGKADALLRRHVPPRAGPDEADEVPVLTELITPGGTLSPRVESTAAAATPVPAHAPDADDDFTRGLVADVVATVQSRLAQDLERRLTQHLLAEVQASVAATLADLRQDIANAVGDAVAEALRGRLEK